jgi:hypothetical protein
MKRPTGGPTADAGPSGEESLRMVVSGFQFFCFLRQCTPQRSGVQMNLASFVTLSFGSFHFAFQGFGKVCFC